MADDTPARRGRPSGPQRAAETTGAETPPDGTPEPDDAATGPQGPTAASLLHEAERLIANAQIAAPNPALAEVRSLIIAARELASSQPDGGGDGGE